MEGPFTEVDGPSIERDDRFPVRVTVQFYQATATGEISKAQIEEVKAQLDRVYADGDYVGSLVIGGQDVRHRRKSESALLAPVFQTVFTIPCTISCSSGLNTRA
jgi:hypothetical protein